MSSVRRETNNPESLASPEATTAAGRRALAGIKAANSAPTTPAQGIHAHGHRFLHIEVYTPDAGATVDWRLWTFSSASQKWRLDTRFGSSPDYAETVTAGADDNPAWSTAEILGADKVYVELLNFTGTHTLGVDVWLSGYSE
jgi:hypothetical protein